MKLGIKKYSLKKIKKSKKNTFTIIMNNILWSAA
jgi:hypothetical protein